MDSAAIHAGMELYHQFESTRLHKAFNDGYCELIIDKGDIKYI